MIDFQFYEFQYYANALLGMCKNKGLKLATAESCTGGLLAAALTDIAGSSIVFDRGFVTYSNESKTELLGVPASLIDQNGAVSAEVATAMAEGALMKSNASIAISTTGIAGPTGGSKEKPVGLVWFGFAQKGFQTITIRQDFKGSRTEIRKQSVEYALNLPGQYIADR